MVELFERRAKQSEDVKSEVVTKVQSLALAGISEAGQYRDGSDWVTVVTVRPRGISPFATTSRPDRSRQITR